MQERVTPGPVNDEHCIREAVCIHTKKIYDSCKDKDCVEDLNVYLTVGSQEILDRCVSVKAGTAELLHAYIDVEPVGFNRGFYTVDVRYFYQITADAFVGAARPVEITGLAVFDKRVILFGGEGSAKVFTSSCSDEIGSIASGCSLPTAVVEAVDPLILNMKMVDVCECRPCDCTCSCSEIPPIVSANFPEELVSTGNVRRMYISLGQFSIMRLERDTQILTPVYDYCLPEKDCCIDYDHQEDPCEVFRQVNFPVDEFFPPNAVVPKPRDYREARSCGCCN